jgi:hypothetical protein
MEKVKVCEGKDKAKIFIKFKDGKKEEVELEAPAYVELKENEPASSASDTYLIKGTYWSAIPYAQIGGNCGTNEFTGQMAGPGIKIFKEPPDTSGSSTWVLINSKGIKEAIICRYSGLQGLLDRGSCNPENPYGYGMGNSPVITEIKRSDGGTDDPKCRIIVTDKDGKEVYNRQAECPIKWAAGCDNECPSQHLRCRTTAYPGYRCVPCSEFRR